MEGGSVSDSANLSQSGSVCIVLAAKDAHDATLSLLARRTCSNLLFGVSYFRVPKVGGVDCPIRVCPLS